MIKKIHACNKINFSSNINEVIKAVLNFSFFLRKDFVSTKSTKSTKNTKNTKSTKKGKKTLRQKYKTQISEQVTIFPLDVF